MKLQRLIDAVEALRMMEQKRHFSEYTHDEWAICMKSYFALKIELEMILANMPEVEIEA